MILVSVLHTDNGDTPNTGNNLHLTNQVGQDDFKLGGGIFLRNTGEAEFKATLNIKQSLLDVADKEVSSIVKDVPVTILAGKSLDLSPAIAGSIPMKGIDTMKKSYRYRLTVKNVEEVISDTVTGVFLDETNTEFDAPTVPFVAGGGGVVVEKDASAAIALEIKTNDAELVVLNKEIPEKQARAGSLVKRNSALKAVPAVTVVLLMLLAFPCFAADKSLFDQGQVSVETFAGGATADFKHFEGLYGVGMQYAFHKHWSVGARVLHSGFDFRGVLVDDVQGRLTGRLPLSVYTKLAPFVYLGAGYRIGWPNEKGRDQFHLDSGAGLEFRFTPKFGTFAEAGWSANLNGRNTFASAAGVRWTF